MKKIILILCLFSISLYGGFFDHFTGASLNARWTEVTSGTGAVSVTDSYVKFERPSATDAAYIFYNTELDTTDSQLWLVCMNVVDATFRRALIVRNTATPGTAQAFGSSDHVIQCQVAVDAGSHYLNLEWYDTGGTRRRWNPNSNTWATSGVQAEATALVGLDNYFVFGLEIDADSTRFRMMAWTIKAPSTSYTFDQGGPRLFQLTDWVQWDSTQTAKDDMYLVLPHAFNSAASDNDVRIEWIRMENGARRFAWMNGKTNQADNYDIRMWYTYGDVFVPEDRSTIAIGLGAGGSWDDAQVKDQFVVKDGSNYRIFYAGNDGSTWKIGGATTSNAYVAPTKSGSNPFISPPSGYNHVVFPYVFKDSIETVDSLKWKMLAVGVTSVGANFRILYFTSGAWDGTWTYQDTILTEGGVGDPDETGVTNPVPYWDEVNYQWVVFFARKRDDPTTSDNIEDVSYATGSTLTSLTKSGDTTITWQAGGDDTLAADLNSRTIQIVDSTGFEADQIVFVTNDNTVDNYSFSRIRKVYADSLKLYHKLDGFTNAAGHVIQADRSHGMYLRHVEKIGSTYYFWGVIYRQFKHVSSKDILAESTALWTHSGSSVLNTAPTLETLLYPNNTATYFGHERSSENIAIETAILVRAQAPAAAAAAASDSIKTFPKFLTFPGYLK